MSQLWGFAAGEQAAQQMQQRQQMVNIATAEAPLRMQSMDIANKMSTLALQRQEMFNRGMEQSLNHLTSGKEGGDTLGDQIKSMAELALESGNPQMASKYLDSYTSYSRNKETIANNQAKLAVAHARVIDSLMQGVHDERSWKAANAAYMMQTGKPSPFSNVPFAQAKQSGLLDRIQAAALDAVKRAQINKDNAQARAAEANASLIPYRRELVKRQSREAEIRTAHLEKSGAVATKAMNENLKVLTDLVNKSYSVDPTRQAAVRAIMRPWAERMEAVMRQNPDMSETQAAAKVMQEAKQAHTFAGFEDYRGLPGGLAKTAIPYTGNPKELKDNHWYKTNKGVLLYQGGKFYTEQEVQATRQQ